MTHQLFTNNANTTLASGITSGSLSANLVTGTGALFPSPTGGNFFLMTFSDAATGLILEIVKVTARSGDTITIVRAQEGTTARSWAPGDNAVLFVTAGTLAAFAQPDTLQYQAGNYAIDASVTSNLVNITLTPAPPNLAALVGAPIRIKKNGLTNGAAAVTLIANGFTPAPIIFPNGSQLTAGTLPGGGIFEVVYDGSAFEMISAGVGIPTLGTAAFANASNTAESYVSSVFGAVTPTHVAVFTDALGTVGDGGALGTAAFAAASSLTGTVAAVGGLPATIGNVPLYTDIHGSLGAGVTPGTAITKNASNNSDTVVASVTSAAAGNAPIFLDGGGTLGNSGVAIGAAVTTGIYHPGAGLRINEAHTLGPVLPPTAKAEMYFQCLISELGYAVGSRTTEVWHPDTASQTGITVWCDGTTFGATFSNNLTGSYVLNLMPKGGGTATPLTPANWKVVVVLRL